MAAHLLLALNPPFLTTQKYLAWYIKILNIPVMVGSMTLACKS